jgi:hypothetical protein
MIYLCRFEIQRMIESLQLEKIIHAAVAGGVIYKQSHTTFRKSSLYMCV